MKEAQYNMAQQRMLKTGEVQTALQSRETNQVSNIDGLGYPIVACTCSHLRQGTLKIEEVQMVHPPNVEKRGSP